MVRARSSSRGICGLENSCWQLAVGCCSIGGLAAIQPRAASRQPRAASPELPNYRTTELPNQNPHVHAVLAIGSHSIGAVAVLMCVAAASAPAARSAGYDDLLTLFKEWRDFQRPKLVQGVPDYSAAAMAAQHRELPRFQARLNGDRSGCVARAAASGLAPRARGDERARLRPSRAQAVGDQPGVLRHGVSVAERSAGARRAHGRTVRSSSGPTRFRSRPTRRAAIGAGIRAIPGLLEQAKKNLTGKAGSLDVRHTAASKHQSADLARLASALAGCAGGRCEADVRPRPRRPPTRSSAWLDAQRLKNRPFRRRHRELRLVSEERAARARTRGRTKSR